MRDVRMKGFRERTGVEAALAMLEQRTGALDAESIPITEAADRVAAADVIAAVDVPHFARAAMDGYAVDGESTFGATAHAPVELRVRGASAPGRPFPGRVGRLEAVRIATGAPLPAGCDAVLMAEHAEEEERDGAVWVRVSEAVAPLKNVGDVGEDVRRGTTVVARGRRLRPQDLAVLSGVGAAAVDVVRRPRVRILVTGDELLPPGTTPSGAFIADANSPMLAALCRRDGAGDVSRVHVPDRRERVRDAVAETTEHVLLVSGGTSVGPEDHAPGVLAEIGEIAVHGVAMRPASPAGFGFFGTGRRQIAFLLPGNPVSCLCAYEFFAGPTIRALGGRPRAWPHRRRRCRVASKIVSPLGRTDYVRVTVRGDDVTPIMVSGSSIISSTTRADGVVIVESGDEGHREGEWVEVLFYD
ncbi:MAG: molybdopterin molybdotransferase MoeA [Acidobacteriia bacterium]|nr:molybdopterin molybdotransferase MoeA [Terriglobia bacterium]